MDACLDRYSHLYGSDERVHACLTDLGVPLTKEPGLNQAFTRYFKFLTSHFPLFQPAFNVVSYCDLALILYYVHVEYYTI